MCIQLIHDGLLKIEDAARKLNMEEAELKKYLELYDADRDGE